MEARIDNYTTWVQEADHQKLVPSVEKMLKGAGFTILNFVDHHFQPQGYTALWLLAESHCALHTFPEESKAYIEISSCNSRMFIDFLDLLNRQYQRL